METQDNSSAQNLPALAPVFNDAAQAALRLAAQDENIAHIAAILKQYPGAAATYTAQQVLMESIEECKVAVALALLDGGVSPDDSRRKGETPLTLAVQCGLPEVVEKILDMGGDVNKANTDGCTPFLLAVWKDNLAVARQLHARGANIDRPNSNGETSLILAIAHNYETAARFLLAAGADIAPVDHDGVSARSEARKYLEKPEGDLYIRLLDISVEDRRRAAEAAIEAEKCAISENTLGRLQQCAGGGAAFRRKSPPPGPQ